ncbi:MAG: AmmeMemoRadiSam system radical SAM enzyme [Verrucomicrobia bacterium]|nr:AmmeMemoRadiSam system radical SAM enzyme [Verrucomicrobiota bacterium]MBU4246949.1 AmmeMemoRadiSam system radical SAM enzyme [Verrucomicrobiota bacterium]MBU4291343.1 AmmeMemoRadiSam system radical SAM enzyme [Verrucomicrobiota bacterium]MBU4498080.1 AmmeMemoRadiSam system radical SAM enzyme [Verrucomicrobiota bacterium]MCG2680045.1 AmmeMemoRadiSam system radical SAM enzyme [Kiritimatiellia bacterium]
MQANYPCDSISRRHFLATLGAGAAGCALARLAPAADKGPLHEALFYDKLDKGTIRCRLCPRGCIVADGKRGYCRVRENRKGTYYSLVYGRPCATHLDPIEKKPFFHVYPGSLAYSIATVGCNLSCKFCQNWDISQASPEDVSVPYRAPADIASTAKRSKAKTIAYTYNEPTIYPEYLMDCARAGREVGIESVMVSNGFISAEAQQALLPLLKAIKIDLKAFTPSFYPEVCGGRLQPVLDSLKRLSGSGVWYEIVALVIPTLNDSADEIKRMSAWIVKELGPDVPLHFSRFHPIYKMKNIPPTPPETLRRAREIAAGEGIHFVYIGNVPGEEAQNTLCPSCKAMLIRRYGYRILENTIVNGRCQACGKPVPGVWS